MPDESTRPNLCIKSMSKSIPGPDCPNVAPIYEDELGRVSFRRNASNYQPVISEILEYAKYQVDKFYLDLIDELDLEEDDGGGDERKGGSVFDESRKDRAKTRLGLNVMEKTIKSIGDNGARRQRHVQEDDDGYDDVWPSQAHTRDLMVVNDEKDADHVSGYVNCEATSQLDELLGLCDDTKSEDPISPLS